MICEKCGKPEGDHRIELYWENRKDEARKHYVCDSCFDEIQSLFKHEQPS